MDLNESKPPEEAKDKKGKKRAVALAYDPGADNAPRVLASGYGLVAERILAIAKEHDLPIRDDPILTEALLQVDLNQEIPPELYAVVAEVFAFVHRLKKKRQYG